MQEIVSLAVANLKRKTLKTSPSPVLPRVNVQSLSASCKESLLPDVLLLDAKSTGNSHSQRNTPTHVENRDMRFVPDVFVFTVVACLTASACDDIKSLRTSGVFSRSRNYREPVL